MKVRSESIIDDEGAVTMLKTADSAFPNQLRELLPKAAFRLKKSKQTFIEFKTDHRLNYMVGTNTITFIQQETG
jgi:hypothetical protein